MVQIFDSWGGQLPPRMWDQWSKPYIKRIVESVKSVYPDVPLTLYANGQSLNDPGCLSDGYREWWFDRTITGYRSRCDRC